MRGETPVWLAVAAVVGGRYVALRVWGGDWYAFGTSDRTAGANRCHRLRGLHLGNPLDRDSFPASKSTQFLSFSLSLFLFIFSLFLSSSFSLPLSRAGARSLCHSLTLLLARTHSPPPLPHTFDAGEPLRVAPDLELRQA